MAKKGQYLIKNGSLSYYLHRINTYHTVFELSGVFKQFLRDVIGIKYEYTFEEIEELSNRKHILPETKEAIKSLCKDFEMMEYRPTHPSKKDIKSVQDLFKKIVKQTIPEPEKTKNHSFFKNIYLKKEKIKTQVAKQKMIALKAENKKTDIVQNLTEIVKERLNKSLITKEDKESQEIKRFIITSQSAGVKLLQIKKELIEMGFDRAKIDKSLKN